MSGALAVTGLREFQRACANSDKELKDFLRTGLRALGEPVHFLQQVRTEFFEQPLEG